MLRNWLWIRQEKVSVCYVCCLGLGPSRQREAKSIRTGYNLGWSWVGAGGRFTGSYWSVLYEEPLTLKANRIGIASLRCKQFLTEHSSRQACHAGVYKEPLQILGQSGPKIIHVGAPTSVKTCRSADRSYFPPRSVYIFHAVTLHQVLFFFKTLYIYASLWSQKLIRKINHSMLFSEIIFFFFFSKICFIYISCNRNINLFFYVDIFPAVQYIMFPIIKNQQFAHIKICKQYTDFTATYFGRLPPYSARDT